MAANEWKKEVISEMGTRRKLLKEHKNNIKSTLECTAGNVKALLNRQKETLEEFNKIASESLNAESISKKTMIDKFQTIEQAVSSLDVYFTEANENKVDKTNRVHSSIQNYLKLGSEIVEKLTNYGENSVKNINDTRTEAEDSVPGVISEKWEDLKRKQDSAFTRYKNLTEELERLSKTNLNFCGIRDSVRRCIKDIDESNEQLKVSKTVQMMADSVMKRGNNFVDRMYKNYAHVETSLLEDEQNMKALAESSKRLSKTIDSKISECRQFLRNDLWKRFEQNDCDEVNITKGESFSGTNPMLSERTVCLPNAAFELTLPQEDSVHDTECTMCCKNTNETLKPDDISVSLYKYSSKNTTELPGSSKSFTSAYPRSPVGRQKRKNPMIARKNLAFPDIEKLANEWFESSSGDES